MEGIDARLLFTLQAMVLELRSLTGLLLGGLRMYWLRPSPWNWPLSCVHLLDLINL